MLDLGFKAKGSIVLDDSHVLSDSDTDVLAKTCRNHGAC